MTTGRPLFSIGQRINVHDAAEYTEGGWFYILDILLETASRDELYYAKFTNDDDVVDFGVCQANDINQFIDSGTYPPFATPAEPEEP